MSNKDLNIEKQKTHRKKQSGISADKKKKKTKPTDESTTARQRNPKAFAIQSAERAERRFRRTEDLTAKRQHIPFVDKTPDEPPPILIAVVGPPKVGKSTLIENLIKSFTRTNVTNITGPITIVTSKKRRITLIECNNDINSMIDLAKCADLVLLMCDASFGFEMEIFEFLNICQVHGMPKIMGILTHLDAILNPKMLKRRKKELKHRFWTEVYNGAKLFYLSGIIHGEYLRNEIKNLGRFISIIKFRPLTWRGVHSYILADRMEDITNTEDIRLNEKCDRNIVLYGYIRGVALNKENMVHIAGLGDMRIDELNKIPDPCALPATEKKRNLLEKEKLLYAPMSGVGGIVYDKDAVYIELHGSHSHTAEANEEQEEIVQELIDKKSTFDTQIKNQEFRFFSDGDVIKSSQFTQAIKDKNIEENSSMDDEYSNTDDNDDDANSDGTESGVEEDNDTNQQNRRLAAVQDDNQDEDFQTDEESSDEEYQENIQFDHSFVNEFANDGDRETKLDRNLPKTKLLWKENLTQKARAAYLDRQSNTQNLMKLVYGYFNSKSKREQAAEANDDLLSNSDDEIGGLFKIVSNQQRSVQKDREYCDADESCFFEEYAGEEQRNWLHGENKQLLQNCFVTGKWRATEDAEELLRLDDLSDVNDSETDEMYGDFEDLETGEKYNSQTIATDNDMTKNEDTNEKPEKKIYSRVEDSNLTKTELMARKMKLKEQFDAEYDDKDDAGRITGDHAYYKDLKAQASKQSELNKNEFNALDEDLRIEIEGYRAGLYVRLGFKNVPCEFVTNFQPNQPILIGVLNMSEENIGYVTCKIKKHRWYKKILKTNDPLIISLGWRRFQSMPIYAKIEDDMKYRYLKYTPAHVTCSMTFWGPITPQNTGLLAVQTVKQQNIAELRRIGFRIAATGCVSEVDKTLQIVKKLKLIGTPLKIFKKSAFITGMFSSSLEVSKFEGAKIKTVSGIRGQIKRAHNKPEGSFRSTFEDRILLSDIVMCRTWYNVDVKKFYTPVTNLLLPIDGKTEWEGMKSVGQLKRERNIRSQVKMDSLYKEIKREPKIFKPLKIPKSLQNALPYKDKPKLPSKNVRKSFHSQRVAVIQSPHEQKTNAVMKMIRANYEAKKQRDKTDTIKRVAKLKAQKTAIEMRRLKRQKELKKKICRAISRMDKGNKQMISKTSKN